MGVKRKDNRKGELPSESLSRHAWRRFKADKLAMFGIIFIVFLSVIAILGSLVRPDETEDVSQRIDEIEFQPPGFKSTILRERLDLETEYRGIFDRMAFGGKSLTYKNYAITNYEIDGGLITFKVFNKRGEERIIVKNLASIVYPLDYANQFEESPAGDSVTCLVLGQGKVKRAYTDLAQQVKADFIEQHTYWLGTAKAGRDMLSLIMASLIVSLSVGFIAVFISLTIGISLGALAGYFRGWVDDLIMFIINVVWSIPTFLIVIAISIAIGKGYQTVFVAIGVTLWVEVARVVRGQVMAVREKEFVEASKALGYSSWRIIFRHLLPNVLGPIIVLAAANFAFAILMESGLSFLGIGTQPPQPSLGTLVAEYRNYMSNEGLAYLVMLPGITIVILVLAFMLIGNGLRDALDQRSVNATGTN